jgi:Flp pilus assembly protein TadD
VLLQLEPGRYSSLPLASEAALRAGESIRVVGHPHGGPQRVSPGTLVGIKDLSALLEDYVLLELLAHVAPGSSGSPVLNERGEVVGIVSGYQPSSQTAAVAWSAKPVARWLTNIRLGPQPLPLSPPPVTDDFAAFHDEEIRLWEKASRASRRAEAFAHIQNIVQRYPKSSAARVLLTGEHIERREYAKAEHQAREATQINPQNAAAWSLLSSVLNVQSRPAEAERAARHARSLKPDFPTATIQLSIALNAQGRHAEAAEVLLPLCEQDAHNPGAIRLLGASLRRAGQKALESQILNRLRLLDPGKARALESTMNPSGPERP